MRRRTGTFAVLVASVVAVSSCSMIDVNSLPQPGQSYRDGYDIVLAFDNVLNLPLRAKVVLNGVTVGVVTNVALKTQEVDVTARVGSGTVVPSNTEASLQQATVLGDIYVALERPHTAGSPAPALGPGGRIARSQTTSPPQLEDTIASLANFVSSGSIQRMQNTVIRLNRLTPPPTEVRRLTSRVVDDLTDLSNNIDQVDQLLDGVSRTAEVLHARIPQLQDYLSPRGQLAIARSMSFYRYLATLLPGVGSITLGGYWLVPLLNSLGNTFAALFQRSKIAFEEEIPKYRRLFTNFFLPEDKYPAINITSIIGPDGREMSGNVQDLLRILGAMP
jgi:phospholipid/cholesterol/gamma-HCH transport system substrate-binding protein